MEIGMPKRIIVLALVLGLALGLGCDESSTTSPPAPYVPIMETLVLTPSLDAGSPIPLEERDGRLAILYTALLSGSGDIFRLVLEDSSGDQFYDRFPTVQVAPNQGDPSIVVTRPAHDQFTFIGAYEAESDGVSGDTTVITYPGATYLSGPRHMVYDETTDRIFYSMGIERVAQIASTQSPRDAFLGHVDEIINGYDPPIDEISSEQGRPPDWDFWYTKVQHGQFFFTGGYYASVSPLSAGSLWIAYADTLFESYDRDGFDQRGSARAGEDPVGAIEVVEDGEADDGAPGRFLIDDDQDGGTDLEDAEVAAMLATNVTQPDSTTPATMIATWNYAWSVQQYDPARDDDEDGLMDEDWSEQIDNDGDLRFGEDGPEPFINQDGDLLTDEDPIDGIDNDGDGLIDEDPSEQVDNDGDGRLNEDPWEQQIDNDRDGRIDEDHPGDMNGDGAPGRAGLDDADADGKADLEDPQVAHSLLRLAQFIADEYDPATDDDEDGISDEDANVYRSGLWVVKLLASGLPDVTAVPISLTNDGGRQPFFNPMGNDLLYVLNGDIHRLTLEFTANGVAVTANDNLTNSPELEAYPAYNATGDRIVYSSSRNGSADIWLMDATGAGAVRVTNLPGQELLPRFTPSGRQILFEAWRFPEGDRRVMITMEELP